MKPIFALDADGVLLDYNLAYAKAWERSFGVYPIEIDPNAYWATDRWDVSHLTGIDLNKFKKSFDEEFWSTVPLISGALKACTDLHDAGYELVCVTAVDLCHQGHRLQNLQDHGLPINRVIATGSNHSLSRKSPKAQAVLDLKPVAFVDDYLPYMMGVHQGVHKALIMRGTFENNPNLTDKDLEHIDSIHDDLLSFSAWWLNNKDMFFHKT